MQSIVVTLLHRNNATPLLLTRNPAPSPTCSMCFYGPKVHECLPCIQSIDAARLRGIDKASTSLQDIGTGLEKWRGSLNRCYYAATLHTSSQPESYRPFSNTCFYDDLQCKRSLDAALKGHCFYILRTLAQPLFQARNLWEKEIALRR